MTEIAGEPPRLLWEALVTDGHVRAARLRWIEPWLIGLGVLLILGGICMSALILPKPAPDDRGVRIAAELGKVQAGAIAAMNGLAPVPVPSDRLANPVSASQISRVSAAILDDLNGSGYLPTDKLNMNVVDADTFWHHQWFFSSLNVTSSGETTLVGAVVNEGTQDSPQLTHWLGVFRRRNGHWEAVSIAAPGFYIDPTLHSTTADRIPLTLKSVLPVAP
jgi:hypothetical protein